MAKETAPAFQLYVKEWRSSRAVMRMTMAQRGMFLEMLLEQWENYSLPDDPRAVCELIGGDEAEWVAAWPVLRRKFCDRRSIDRAEETPAVYAANDYDATRRIVNVKLEDVRRERKAFVKTARKGGLARAKSAKRDKDGTYVPAGEPAAIQPDASRYPAVVQPSASTASASPTASASASSSPSATASVPPLAGKEPPMQLHLRRLKVWRYMLERWTERLGDHADAFDIHGWLSDLDGQLSGVVLPSTGHEWWTFLDARFSAEVRRRGLPMVAAPAAMGKQTTKLAAAIANIRQAEAV